MKEDVTGFIGGIQRFSTSDGPGIRTTVFLKGCPLSCQWCHNPELIDPRPQLMRSAKNCINCGCCMAVCKTGAIKAGSEGIYVDWPLCDRCMNCAAVCAAEAMRVSGEPKSVEEIMEVVRRDRGFYEKSGGGMTISGGELLLQPDFSEALLDAACAEGFTVALDTCGCGDGKRLKRMAQKARYILYDMKCIIPERHKEYTGRDNKAILENLRILAADPSINPKIIMRMPLVHGVNDTDEVISATSDFYRENHLSSVTLIAYHELGISKCEATGRPVHRFEPPAHERMLEIKKIFEETGMNTEILGEDIA